MAGRCYIVERVCNLCTRQHRLAVELLACGRLNAQTSPATDRCYVCQLGQLAEVERAVRKMHWKSIWLRSPGGHGTVPGELL